MIYAENRTIVAHEGDDTRLSAEFCSNPMVNKIFWIASDRVIRPGTAVGPITAHNITVSQIYKYSINHFFIINKMLLILLLLLYNLQSSTLVVTNIWTFG